MTAGRILTEIGMICANTARTKIYLQALIQSGIHPNRVLIMETGGKEILPGQRQVDSAAAADRSQDHTTIVLGMRFDADRSLTAILSDAGIPFDIIDSVDINSDIVISRLSACNEAVFIYSGIGGAILRRPVLSVGKRFLHVHGGYLPQYKGSTTNYYSWLHGDGCGASSIFLEPALDSGPILFRKTFPPPPKDCDFDYLYESAMRAHVLVKTLETYVSTGRWQPTAQAAGSGDVYYIIHPVLRHLALFQLESEPIP